MLALLNDVDPYGLQPGTAEGAPQDEYALEAAPIVSLLLKNGAVRSNEVDAIWVTWFQEPLSKVIGSENVGRFCASSNSLNIAA
ncbi:hypothetical protein [Arthrobacter sp. TMS1-12-1]